MSSISTIITIGRQYGSAGREIGKKLAEEYGIQLYDKEMLDRAAKESGICQELFEHHDEKPTNSFLYSLVMDTYSMGYSSGVYNDMPLNHKIFLAQFDAIKKIADEGPCVLVGRCADYALESYSNVMSVFIHADMNARIRRIARIYDLTDAKAKDRIQKMDKQRSSYYYYYTNKKWGDIDSYDFSLCSSELGIDGTVKALKALIEIRESVRDKKL
ncbi:cytidylate kinase-like family protein [Candidatus Bariatricus faecipullorum]